jgi:hypothetical protein
LNEQGAISRNGGDVYEGDFVDQSKHGRGKMIYADGRVQEGNWKKNEFVG